METILLIDDNNGIRENIGEILQMAHYRVLHADNGTTGIELAVAEKPNLVICDISMPGTDGYGVLQHLSKNEATASIPFIFITAKTDRHEVRKGMEMGASDYITKPFDDTELLTAVEVQLKKWKRAQPVLNSTIELSRNFMAEFRTTEVASLMDKYPTQKIPRKNSLYKVGQIPTHLYFICSGKIKTVRSNEEGKDFITGIYKEGDFLGYTALLVDTEHKDTAEVLEDAGIIMIPKADFELLLNSDTEIVKSFIQILTKGIVEKEELLLNLAYSSLRKRVANALLQLFAVYKPVDGGQAILDISREDLARVIGTVTESLSRVLSDFKSEKIVEVHHGKLMLTDEKRLQSMVN